jgi:hypothetical protein
MFRTFKRSATNWRQFATARKITVDTHLTEAEAQAQCREYNDNRTPTQRRRGTKMEYERQ